ncbi:hypothetical protein ARMSODRAFT_957065, partial [Armillaria solidipes]
MGRYLSGPDRAHPIFEVLHNFQEPRNSTTTPRLPSFHDTSTRRSIRVPSKIPPQHREM